MRLSIFDLLVNENCDSNAKHSRELSPARPHPDHTCRNQCGVAASSLGYLNEQILREDNWAVGRPGKALDASASAELDQERLRRRRQVYQSRHRLKKRKVVLDLEDSIRRLQSEVQQLEVQCTVCALKRSTHNHLECGIRVFSTLSQRSASPLGGGESFVYCSAEVPAGNDGARCDTRHEPGR